VRHPVPADTAQALEEIRGLLWGSSRVAGYPGRRGAVRHHLRQLGGVVAQCLAGKPFEARAAQAPSPTSRRRADRMRLSFVTVPQ